MVEQMNVHVFVVEYGQALEFKVQNILWLKKKEKESDNRKHFSH